MTAGGFLNRHWQKAPLFMPRALPAGLPTLSADELAWLATQEDVESRLIHTERQSSGEHYRVQHGPFSDGELRALPDRDWALLIQDVDKHLPVFRAWFDAVPFVPDWRIDDLMVSCAAAGGSVGPHSDNYGVFLCQGSGRREWHVSASADAPRATVESELSLLEPFSDPDAVTATDGDVLYLPPGVAHWGIAGDLCVTYSIGMRAPTRQELCCGIEHALGRPAPPGGPRDSFYADNDLGLDEALPGRISRRALWRAQTLLAEVDAIDMDDLAAVFAAVVTDPKAWLEPELDDRAAIDSAFAAGRTLPVHGMARLAWCESGGGWAGANGFTRRLDADELLCLRKLCAVRQADLSLLGDTALREWLTERAVFTLPEG